MSLRKHLRLAHLVSSLLNLTHVSTVNFLHGLTMLAIFTPVINVWPTRDCKAGPDHLLSWNVKHIVDMCFALACREATWSQRCPGCMYEHQCWVKQSLAEDDGPEMMRTSDTWRTGRARSHEENPALATPAAMKQVTLVTLGLFQPRNTFLCRRREWPVPISEE